MTHTNVQTKPKHSNLTQVRWTDEQFQELRKIAFESEKQVGVYIRDFMIEHHPQLAPKIKTSNCNQSIFKSTALLQKAKNTQIHTVIF